MKETMNEITIKSYAKINLSLDVLGKRDDGYHEISMILQAIELHDDVTVSFESAAPAGTGSADHAGTDYAASAEAEDRNIEIVVRQTPEDEKREKIPADGRNIVYKAADLMFELFPEKRGTIRIDIEKRIPAAAGLAGGSGNAAAVVLALDRLWETSLSAEELMETGARLGADVPFQMMVQMKMNDALGRTDDPAACTAAWAKGTGTDLTPVKGAEGYVVLSTPDVAVSTKEVYDGIDRTVIEEHPDNAALVLALEAGDIKNTSENMVNVLEKYTLAVYDIVYKKREDMSRASSGKGIVLMSGSGPTVFALVADREAAEEIFNATAADGNSTFLSSALG